jgi:tetratricopeptide (TPR) repeat protein
MTLRENRPLLFGLSQALELDKSGRAEEAVLHASKLVRDFPDATEPHEILATFTKRAGDLAASVRHGRRAVIVDPSRGNALTELAATVGEQGLWEEALTLFDRVRKSVPGSHMAHGRASLVERDLERPRAAQASLKRSLIIEPQVTDVIINLGNILLELGDLDEAGGVLSWAASIEPENALVYQRIALLGGTRIDPKLKRRVDALLARPNMPNKSARPLRFAAALIARQTGDIVGCFRHLEAGKRARASDLGHTFDPAQDAAQLALSRELFDARFFRSLPEPISGGPMPIFIVGMPRSGTTLTEQVLASHSQVHGAGELAALGIICGQVFDAARPDASRAMIKGLSLDHLRPLATSYLQFIHAMAPKAAFITDKMPHNFQYIWLIKRLFPRAPIIHCVRDPVDTCLSCYFQDFVNGHAYTDDLRSLGRHYRFYRALMDHWDAVLPTPVFEQSYERMVEDPEGRIRALLEYCGLPFEAACLSFSNAERSVRTASASQVREGIYRRSSGRWRTYASELGPLLEELGPLVPDAPSPV